jgi:hypothetical protein
MLSRAPPQLLPVVRVVDFNDYDFGAQRRPVLDPCAESPGRRRYFGVIFVILLP